MKIEDKRKKIDIRYGEITTGDVFTYNGDIYIEALDQDTMEVYAVRLEDGHIVDIFSQASVTLLNNVKLMIE